MLYRRAGRIYVKNSKLLGILQKTFTSFGISIHKSMIVPSHPLSCPSKSIPRSPDSMLGILQ